MIPRDVQTDLTIAGIIVFVAILAAEWWNRKGETVTRNRRLMRRVGGLSPNEFARYDALCRQFGARLNADQKYYIAERVKLGSEPVPERVAALGKVDRA